jgi:aminoglycoside 6'-N-acetyltransferase I
MNATKSAVRRAIPGDLDRLAPLLHALWPESSVADHARELALILAGKPPSTMPLVLFVAETQDGTLAGFLEAGLRSHADGCDTTRPVGYVEGWYVIESHRHTGVGASLLRVAEEWARAQDCIEIASDSPASNTLSQRVHESLGFRVAERAVHYRKAL